MKVYCERQDELVVARIATTDHWFFTCCVPGVETLLNRKLHRGEQVALDLTAKEVPMAWHPLKCGKGSMTLPWIWGGLGVAYFLISKSTDVATLQALATVYLGGSVVVAAHVHSHGKCE